MILPLMEQHGGIDNYSPILNCEKYNLQEASKYFLNQTKNRRCCFDLKQDNEKWVAKTSYFVGVDWIVENEQSIYVQAKQNINDVEIDCLGMLQSALQEPENLNHLEGLVDIDFKKSYIKIDQKQDILSLFLIAQFLQILKKIAQKGLRKSYYTKTENLKSRIKGKILVSHNIKTNLSRGNIIDTYCSYQEFGVDSTENRILKKAYLFSSRLLSQQNKEIDTKPLLELINYIHPAFENISQDIDIKKIKSFKSNPLFKEYDQAIKFALLILRRYSYNISKIEQQRIETPPFWIDMSKLFELYVYSKLRKDFTAHGEVIYHKKAYYQEIDFIINSKNLKMVVDAKYKPRYHESEGIDKDDARQVCGYARLESVYTELGMQNERDTSIDCLIIYSYQGVEDDLNVEQFTAPENKIKGYVNIYKVGISLPQIKIKD